MTFSTDRPLHLKDGRFSTHHKNPFFTHLTKTYHYPSIITSSVDSYYMTMGSHVELKKFENASGCHAHAPIESTLPLAVSPPSLYLRSGDPGEEHRRQDFFASASTFCVWDFLKDLNLLLAAPKRGPAPPSYPCGTRTRCDDR